MKDVNVKQRLKADLPWLFAPFFVYFAFKMASLYGVGWDSKAYWIASGNGFYNSPPNTPGAYLYSPAFVQVLWPILQLPWPAFAAIWMVLAGFTYCFLLWPLGWRLAAPLWLCCVPDIVAGNVTWIFALVVAFGLRWPGVWVVVLLTKIVPAVGFIWFLIRREWRNLAISISVSIVVIMISVLLDSQAWRNWFAFLRENMELSTTTIGGGGIAPVVRVPLAFALATWGALRSKYWTIPAAMVLAAPVFGVAYFAVFAGLPRLHRSIATLKDAESN